MDTYKPKFTALQNDIFILLCKKMGESLNQRTIAKLLKVSPTAISKAIVLLKKLELIKVERSKTMNLLLIKINADNEKALFLKRIKNLELIYESGLVKFLEEIFPGSTIILFGSYARGDDTLKSDIDIAIETSKEKQTDLKNFEKIFERNIYLHFYSSLANIEKELKENIFNGIVLFGGIRL